MMVYHSNHIWAEMVLETVRSIVIDKVDGQSTSLLVRIEGEIVQTGKFVHI